MEMRLFMLFKTSFQSPLYGIFFARLIYVNSPECKGNLCVPMFSFSICGVWAVLVICIQQRMSVDSGERAAQDLYSGI